MSSRRRSTLWPPSGQVVVLGRLGNVGVNPWLLVVSPQGYGVSVVVRNGA